jgi:hypothetical protein
MHSLSLVYPRRKGVVILQLEKGEADDGDTLSKQVCRRLCELSDPYSFATSTKYNSKDVQLSQHVVVICNEPCAALLQGIGHKQVWLLRLGADAPTRQAAWVFPSQPPFVPLLVGRRGWVANAEGLRPAGGKLFDGIDDWILDITDIPFPGPMPPESLEAYRIVYVAGLKHSSRCSPYSRQS